MTAKPLCGCGCGQPVKDAQHLWVRGHIPKHARVAWGRKGGRSQGYRKRRAKFEHYMNQLAPSFKRQALLDVLATVYRQAYAIGYNAAIKGRKAQ